jgi:hypothetical protein
MDTRGGNQLEVGSSNLHSDWDGVLDSWNPLQPSHEILALAKAVPATTGDASEWPALWASETQKASQHAYQGLKFSHKQPKKAGDWVTTFPNRPAYVKDKNEVQKREMATAGARLAQILNAVYP